MSTSEQLRRSHTAFGGAAGITSAPSVQQELNLERTANVIVERLREVYPNLKFIREKTLPLTEVMASQHSQHEDLGVDLSYQKAFIRPDGGFVYAILPDGSKRLILAAEAKRQGTNDKREKEGLGKQAMGNALERSIKNYDVIRLLTWDDHYCCYALFGSGCDLQEKSSIRDRVRSMNHYSAINKTYLIGSPNKSNWKCRC